MAAHVAVDMAVDELNMLLSDLDITSSDTKQDDFTEPGIRPGGDQDSEFIRSCTIVIQQVLTLERALGRNEMTFEQEREPDQSGAGIVAMAVARGMPSPTEDDQATARVEALSFLCSELQALCIDAYGAQKQPEQYYSQCGRSGEITMHPHGERALSAMTALQDILEIPDSPSNHTDKRMAAIATKVAALPTPSACQDAGDVPLLQGLTLSPSQQQVADKVHEAVAADFGLRRRMLLRRCDVTIQSFLRGAEVKGMAGDVDEGDGLTKLPEPLKARRASLSEEPRRITMQDVLTAPSTVARKHATKMTTGGDTLATETSMAIVADPPNRGGVVNEARALFMPEWKARRGTNKKDGGGQRGGKGGPGGHGGRKGGGGRGRGEGRRGHHTGGGDGTGRGDGRFKKRSRGRG